MRVLGLFLRHFVVVPIGFLAAYLLFVLPEFGIGWSAGLLLLFVAWLVWILLFFALRNSRAVADVSAPSTVSPGEERGWVGLVFTGAILVYFAVDGWKLIAADGSPAPEAAEVGRHLGFLIFGWLVVMQVLRKRWRDTVEMDERDRGIGARANAWARWSLSLLVLGLAVTLAISVPDRLPWAKPTVISGLLVGALLVASLVEYAVTAISYWWDRH